jgi:hypothetical protein
MHAPAIPFAAGSLSVFLAGAACLALAQDAPLPEAKPVPQVQVTPLPGDEASFTFDGRELTRYRFDPAAKRPFWYPVQTTLAPSLVRMGHPHDPHGHRHHYGVWITHHSVNGVSFWDDNRGPGKGSIVHKQVLQYEDGPESASMVTLNHWISEADQKVLLIETRRMEVRPYPDATSWLLLVDSGFVAPAGQTATFAPTSFGLVGVRMAKSLGVHDGGGRILNSEGQVNEKAVHLQSGRWCDYSGRLTREAFAGITLLNHPDNPVHPTNYHVRDDGWMCQVLSLQKPVVVEGTAPLHVRHGLWIHEGVPDAARCDAVWQAFAQMPRATLKKKS